MPGSDRRRSKAEERAYALMLAELEEQEAELRLLTRRRSVVPEGWGELERQAPVEPRKERVTIRLDAEMLKWYRGLGHGYQRRINAVLRAYMNAVISKAIERRGDRDAKGRPI